MGIADADADVRELLQLQFDLSTTVRYHIDVRIQPYWPDKMRGDTDQKIIDFHKERVRLYAEQMADHIKENLNSRDNMLIMELNDLLEKHSKIPASIIIARTKKMQEE